MQFSDCADLKKNTCHIEFRDSVGYSLNIYALIRLHKYTCKEGFKDKVNRKNPVMFTVSLAESNSIATVALHQRKDEKGIVYPCTENYCGNRCVTQVQTTSTVYFF